jgi:hypothetical protein
VLRAAPERVYRAFLDPDAMVKWLPPNGFTGRVHHMDARVGGTHKMSFTNFTTGKSHSFGGRYVVSPVNERRMSTGRSCKNTRALPSGKNITHLPNSHHHTAAELELHVPAAAPGWPREVAACRWE